MSTPMTSAGGSESTFSFHNSLEGPPASLSGFHAQVRLVKRRQLNAAKERGLHRGRASRYAVPVQDSVIVPGILGDSMHGASPAVGALEPRVPASFRSFTRQTGLSG